MPEPFGSREGNRVVIGGVALHQLGDCVFDWAVHHVKHVWLDDESEYPKPIKREISDEEYENWEKMDGLLGG